MAWPCSRMSARQRTCRFSIPASPSAEAIRSLSLLVAGITAFIFIIVEGVLFYSIARFRRRSATQTDRTAAGLRQQANRNRLDRGAGLDRLHSGARGHSNLWAVNRPPPRPKPGDQALFVTVVGHQWWWEYVYETYNGRKLGVITANELHVPASEEGVARPVYLTLKSADVCHSFWVPRLAGKTDLIPGHPNQMWFQTDKPDCISANVPSIAARSTPTCCCASWSMSRPISSVGWPTKRNRPPSPTFAMPLRAQASRRSWPVVRQLSSRARHAGAAARSGPT